MTDQEYAGIVEMLRSLDVRLCALEHDWQQTKIATIIAQFGELSPAGRAFVLKIMETQHRTNDPAPDTKH